MQKAYKYIRYNRNAAGNAKENLLTSKRLVKAIIIFLGKLFRNYNIIRKRCLGERERERGPLVRSFAVWLRLT